MQTLVVRSFRIRFVPVAAVIAFMLIAATTGIGAAAPGATLWVQRYNGLSAGTDFASDGAVSPDGSTVFVTGAYMKTSEDHDIATIAYDASDGTQKWIQRYAGPAGGYDVGTTVLVSPDGSTVFVTGSDTGLSFDDDYVTVAYSASDGTELWVRRYTRTDDTTDRADALEVSSDGQMLFVTGESFSQSSDAYVTLAYATADGARLWRYVSDGIAQENDLALSPDATRVFVTGGVIGAAGDKDYSTIALDVSTGTKVWGQRYDGGSHGNDAAMAVGVGPSGSKIFVTGRSDGPTTLGNFATIAYGATDGSLRWVRRFHAPGHTYSDVSLAIAPDGSRVVVTGSSVRTAYEEYATVAYGASGAKVWADRYQGAVGKYSLPFDVAITGDSREVIVTGGSWGATKEYDFATIAYGATHGSRSWVRRYDGPDGLADLAFSVAISPDDSAVFVVGHSDTDIHLDDYLTIAYSLK